MKSQGIKLFSGTKTASGDTKGIAASAHRARTSDVATIGTAAAHGLAVGDGIIISGMGAARYNGTWLVASVPDTTHFTYANTGTNETETADTAGTITKVAFIDVAEFKGGLFFLKCTAKSGTPTLVVTVITYDKKTDDWYDLVAFTQLSDVGKEMKAITDVGSRIAISYVIGGGTPSLTFTVSAILKNV